MTTGVVVVTTPDQVLSQPVITNTAVRDGNGVYVNGTGASVSGTDVDISTTGTPFSNGLSVGVRVENGSVDLQGGTVSTSGTRFTRGLLATGSGAVITTNGTDISTSLATGVLDSHAVVATGGATIDLTGGSVATGGGRSYGLYSLGAGSFIKATDVAVSTRASIAVFADEGGAIDLIRGSVETNGLLAHGVVAGSDSTINLDGTSINVIGERSQGLLVNEAGGSIDATDVTVVTHGAAGYGAHATGADTFISLNGGSITTLNGAGDGTEGPTSSRSHAVLAEQGSHIEASNLAVSTHGQRSFAVHALTGSTIDLENVTVSTSGFEGYGLYAWGADSVINATNVNVTTTGGRGIAVWAYEGATLNIDGGVYHVQGEGAPGEPDRGANGFAAMGGPNSPSATINASNMTLITEGAGSIGLQIGGESGGDLYKGEIHLADSTVTVKGADGFAAHVGYGSVFTDNGSTLTATQGTGIRLVDNATVDLVGTTIIAAKETLVSNLNSAGQSQLITLGAGTTATQNNGTLLLVNREAAGADGVVTLTLADGSLTRGNIVDLGAKTTGGTDVTLGAGADWAGQMFGVRNFFSAPGGDVSFEGEAVIVGNLTGNGTSFTFSPEGGSIGGDVMLASGASTTGGSIQTPIFVAGDVSVDDTSIFGGNWVIAGDMASGGTLTPGNSIGRVSIGGDLTLGPSSVYAVEIDASGDADQVNVGGTARLDGVVTVTPLGGYLIGTPYTILTAGGFAGTSFDSVTFTDSFAFLSAQLSYSATDVVVTIDRNDVRYASFAQTANQAATANALDSLPLTTTLGMAAALMTAEEAPAAFNSLSGEINASAKGVLINDSEFLRAAVFNRLAGADRPGMASGISVAPLGYAAPAPGAAAAAFPVKAAPVAASAPASALWAQGFGSWGSTDGNGNAAQLDRDTGGFFIGGDTLFNDWRIGVLGGYSQTNFDVDARSSSGSSDNVHAGIYAGTNWGAVSFRAGAAYTWSDLSTSRFASLPGPQTLKADYDAGTAQAFGELGYGIQAGAFDFEPFAGLAYVNLNSDSFTETGGAAALYSASDDTDVTYTTLGLRGSTRFALGEAEATLKGMLGWRHAFGDVTPLSTFVFEAGGSPFSVAGLPIAEDALLVDVGLDVALNEAVSLGVAYSGQFGDGSTDQSVRGSLNWNF